MCLMQCIADLDFQSDTRLQLFSIAFEPHTHTHTTQTSHFCVANPTSGLLPSHFSRSCATMTTMPRISFMNGELTVAFISLPFGACVCAHMVAYVQVCTGLYMWCFNKFVQSSTACIKKHIQFVTADNDYPIRAIIHRTKSSKNV